MNEVRELPNGWVETWLGEIVLDPKKDLVDGPFGSNLKSNEYVDSGIPVFKIQNIKANRFVDKKIDYVTKEKAETISRHSFQSGDLIITKLGDPLGLCCKVPEKFTYGIIVADLMRLRPSSIIVNSDFLIHLINSRIIQQQFQKITKGTTRSRVNLTIVRDIKIPLPPLPEQHRIVAKIEELFSSLEKGIESLKTAQAQLKTYRQAVLKWAFEGKLTNENVKEGELPEGWKWVKLKSVADITSSKRIFQHEYVSEGIPFYRTKEIKELSEGHPLSVDLFISFEKYNEIKSRFQIPKIGDVLLSAVGTIGVSYVIKDNKPFYFKDGNLMWLKDLNGILPYFLSYGLTNYIRNKKGAKTSGSAYNALTIETMKEFGFPLPSITEQKAIVSEIERRLSVCDKLEESIAQSLAQAEALRESILKKAFEGKLVPQNPNDEPANVLLERIRAEREKNKLEKKTRTKKVKE